MSARCPATRPMVPSPSIRRHRGLLFAASAEEGTGLFVASSSDGGITWTGKPSPPAAPTACERPGDSRKRPSINSATCTSITWGEPRIGRGGPEHRRRPIVHSPGPVFSPARGTACRGPRSPPARSHGRPSVWLAFKGRDRRGTVPTPWRGAGPSTLQVRLASPPTRGNFGGSPWAQPGRCWLLTRPKPRLRGPPPYTRPWTQTAYPGILPRRRHNHQRRRRLSHPPRAHAHQRQRASLAWDRSGGQNKGRVYLVYTDATTAGSHATIFCATPTTTARPGAIRSTSATTQGSSEFLPASPWMKTARVRPPATWAWPGTTPMTPLTYHAILRRRQQQRRPELLTQRSGWPRQLRCHQSQPECLRPAKPIRRLHRPRLCRRHPLSRVGRQRLWARWYLHLPQFDLAEGRPAVAHVADLPLTATPLNISADVKDEGGEFTANLATFTDPDPNAQASHYTATIDWGDPDPNTGPRIPRRARSNQRRRRVHRQRDPRLPGGQRLHHHDYHQGQRRFFHFRDHAGPDSGLRP